MSGNVMKTHPFKFSRRLRVIIILLVVSIPAAAYLRLRYPLRYTELIIEYSAMRGLDPALVCAVINTESRFEKDALSSKGARGLMQLTKITADWMANELSMEGYSFDGVYEPEINIALGTYYLSRLGERYGNHTDETLAAYNAGSGNLAKWLSDPAYSDGNGRLTGVPFPETRNYIARVNRSYKVYSVYLRIIPERLK